MRRKGEIKHFSKPFSASALPSSGQGREREGARATAGRARRPGVWIRATHAHHRNQRLHFCLGAMGGMECAERNGRESPRRDCGWVAGSFSESNQGLKQCHPMLTFNLWLSHSSRTRAIRSVFLSLSVLLSGHWFFQPACLSL